jgi:hypothetical protein
MPLTGSLWGVTINQPRKIRHQGAYMPSPTRISRVDHFDDKVVVEFTDGTVATYDSTFLYESRGKTPNAIIGQEQEDDGLRH